MEKIENTRKLRRCKQILPWDARFGVTSFSNCIYNSQGVLIAETPKGSEHISTTHLVGALPEMFNSLLVSWVELDAQHTENLHPHMLERKNELRKILLKAQGLVE